MRLVGGLGFLFLFKQKTAYEMRISDWSSDVCSSDLAKHKTGFFRRAAIDMGTDAQGTAIAESLGYGPLLTGETRVPHQRTIAKNPKFVHIPRHAFPAAFSALHREHNWRTSWQRQHETESRSEERRVGKERVSK